MVSVTCNRVWVDTLHKLATYIYIFYHLFYYLTQLFRSLTKYLQVFMSSPKSFHLLKILDIWNKLPAQLEDQQMWFVEKQLQKLKAVPAPSDSHRFFTRWQPLWWEHMMKQQKQDSVYRPENSDGLCSHFAPTRPSLADGNGLVSIWGGPRPSSNIQGPIKGTLIER